MREYVPDPPNFIKLEMNEQDVLDEAPEETSEMEVPNDISNLEDPTNLGSNMTTTQH